MIDYLKNRLKGKLYEKVGVRYNRYGVSFILGKHIDSLSNVNVIDVGAHCGSFTWGVEQLCTVKRGVLIEPQPAHAAHLRKRFSSPRFDVVEAAISNHAGTIELEINCFDATTSILKTQRSMPELAALNVQVKSKVNCMMLTLDAAVEKSNLDHVDLLKVDVQGAEHLVLCGGKNTLMKTKMVWIEVSFKRLYEHAALFNEIYDMLVSNGFSLFELDSGFRGPNGELIQADALFIRK